MDPILDGTAYRQEASVTIQGKAGVVDLKMLGYVRCGDAVCPKCSGPVYHDFRNKGPAQSPHWCLDHGEVEVRSLLHHQVADARV